MCLFNTLSSRVHYNTFPSLLFTSLMPSVFVEDLQSTALCPYLPHMEHWNVTTCRDILSDFVMLHSFQVVCWQISSIRQMPGWPLPLSIFILPSRSTVSMGCDCAKISQMTMQIPSWWIWISQYLAMCTICACCDSWNLSQLIEPTQKHGQQFDIVHIDDLNFEWTNVEIMVRHNAYKLYTHCDKKIDVTY